MLLDLIQLKQKYNLKITGVVHIGAHYGRENSIYELLDIRFARDEQTVRFACGILRIRRNLNYSKSNLRVFSEIDNHVPHFIYSNKKALKQILMKD